MVSRGKNDQKMLRHSGRPLRAQARCLPAARPRYIQVGRERLAGTIIGHAGLRTLPTTSTAGHISAKRSAWPAGGTGRAQNPFTLKYYYFKFHLQLLPSLPRTTKQTAIIND